MNNQNIIFKINDNQYLKIINLCPDGDHLYRNDEVKIVLIDNNREYILSEENYLIPELDKLNGSLYNIVQENEYLHESIKEDIGFLWNEYLKKMEDPKFVEIKNSETDYWTVRQYSLWESEQYESWLYQTKNNSIIFELTPRYLGHFGGYERGKQYPPYEEFIKSYKPVLFIEFSKEIAYQWFDQIKKLIPIIEASDAKYLHQIRD